MNLFELFVKVGVDDQASGKVSALSQKLGNGLKTAAKIGTAAVSMAAAGITALTTAAVKNYAEYEQLVGGVQTLFNKTELSLEDYAKSVGKTTDEAFEEWRKLTAGARIVQNNADAAFRSAGLSANEYMSTVTSFSASLIASLEGDTVAAAKVADRAIIDMADNANKMGTSMEMLQTTYAGFAKQNYTMLDNLKLGYGGTKEEMARLIQDASKMTDVQKELNLTVDAGDMSFGNIVNAISVMQESMGIAGATAEEAATTISGSLGMLKASWQNVLTAFSDDNASGDNMLYTYIQDLVESATTAFNNLLPAVQQALVGIAELISQLAPIIVEKLPSLIDEILPSLINSAVDVVDKLITVLPSIISSLLPSIINGVVSLISSLANSLPTLIDSILAILPDLIDQLVSAVVELTPKLTETVVKIVQSIADNLPEIIQAIVDAIPQITESVNNAILENFPALLQAIIQIIMTIVENLPTIIQVLNDQIPSIVETIVQVLVENLPLLIAGIVQIVAGIIQALPEITKSLGETVLNIFASIGKGIKNAWPKFKEGVKEVWGKLEEWFNSKLEDAKNLGKNIIDGIKQGIKNAWANLKQWFKNLFGDLIGIAKKILGIKSPSRVFRMIGQYVDEGLQEGLEDGATDVYRTVENISDGVIGAFGDDYDYGVTTSSTSIGDFGGSSSAYRYNNSQNVNVTVGIDNNANAMGLARALLPFLKIAEKEVYA